MEGYLRRIPAERIDVIYLTSSLSVRLDRNLSATLKELNKICV